MSDIAMIILVRFAPEDTSLPERTPKRRVRLSIVLFLYMPSYIFCLAFQYSCVIVTAFIKLQLTLRQRT